VAVQDCIPESSPQPPFSSWTTSLGGVEGEPGERSPSIGIGMGSLQGLVGQRDRACALGGPGLFGQLRYPLLGNEGRGEKSICWLDRVDSPWGTNPQMGYTRANICFALRRLKMVP